MYGARSSRSLDAREGVSLSQLSMMPRKSVYGGANDNNSGRGSRGKAIMDEDARLGSSRGDIRVTSFLGSGGKSRGSMEHADHHRSDDMTPYVTMSERRGLRDESMLKMVRGPDETPVRSEGGGRYRDGASGRGERVVRSAAYLDDAKWVRNANLDSVNYDDGAGGLRESDYLPVTKSSGSTGPILPGFIFECPRRSILEFFSQKASFVLPFDQRRYLEQVGPGTKIFMFDATVRELHGVFQAESYALIHIDASTLRVSQGAPMRVRVRVAKECIPLMERQFKEILNENYYKHSKFSENLTKEQVMKLLQTFRPVDPARTVHVSLPSTRRALDSGLSHGSQEFHSISDEIVYRKEERWRRGTVDTRSLSGHSYLSHDGARFSSKLPAQILSEKILDDCIDYGDDEGIEEIPASTSRFIASSTPYSTSRGKQQSLRTVSGSRTGLSHLVGNVGHSELKLTEEDWREDIDPRDLLYRKRQPLSSSPLDDLKRVGQSSSPQWKDVYSRGEASVGEMYERPGKGVYKEESSYMSSRRRRHNDIDLNIPLEMGQGEPAPLHDLESKAVMRRVWEDEEEKGYSVSPPKGRSSLRSSSSLPMPDHLLVSSVVDDYEDTRLDPRHVMSVSRRDYPVYRTEEKSRPTSKSFSNGKHAKLHQRPVPVMKTHGIYVKEKDMVIYPSRKRPVSGRDLYNKESTLRGPKAPVFKIKANLQAPGRGKQPERVVTMVDKDGFRPWGGSEGSGNSSASQGRKKKPSVWSRITAPAKGPGQKGAVTQGRGRVFSRLGPNASPSSKRRDDMYGHKNKKSRRVQKEVGDDSETIENIETSPDALQGEDYLNDDMHASDDSEKELEKTSDDLHGWTRKKSSMVNSGDECGIPDLGEYANVKGGRRKLVRPSIGTKGPADDSGRKHLDLTPMVIGKDAEDTDVQLRSRSGSLDMEMANEEAQEAAEIDSPRGSLQDLNSHADDFEEDPMLSSRDYLDEI